MQGAHVVTSLRIAGIWDVSSGIRMHAGGDELELGRLGELARMHMLCEAPSFINHNLSFSRAWCAGGLLSVHIVCGASGCKFGRPRFERHIPSLMSPCPFLACVRLAQPKHEARFLKA